MTRRREPASAPGQEANARTPAGDYGDATRVVDSGTLLAGRAQVAIRHNNTIYFLRETRYRKLILTKQVATVGTPASGERRPGRRTASQP